MNDKTDPTRPEDPARRAMLGTSAKAVALAAGGGFLAGCGPNAQQQTASAASAASAGSGERPLIATTPRASRRRCHCAAGARTTCGRIHEGP